MLQCFKIKMASRRLNMHIEPAELVGCRSEQVTATAFEASTKFIDRVEAFFDRSEDIRDQLDAMRVPCDDGKSLLGRRYLKNGSLHSPSSILLGPIGSNSLIFLTYSTSP